MLQADGATSDELVVAVAGHLHHPQLTASTLVHGLGDHAQATARM